MTLPAVGNGDLEPASMSVDELVTYAAEKQRTLAEILQDDKYDLVSTTHDVENGSYIILAERGTKVVNQGFREMGYSSPSPWTAWTRDERNPQLRDKLGIRYYYDMKRSDGTVRGALRILKTPILAAHWFIEPASDSTVDKNIAEFVEKNLFENLNIPWLRVVEEALLMCEYGYYPMELVWEEKKGQIWLKKLAGRHPLDIQEWEYDENGGPNYLVMEPTESSGWQRVLIPIEKLVVFVFEEEGGDLRGTSVLRSAQKHFFYKDCVDEATEIFTEFGWKKYNEVGEGDRTLSINPSTGLSEWDEITEVKRYPGVHDMIRMESSKFSALTTPDHRWLTKFKGKWRWRTTGTLTQDDNLPKAAQCSTLPTEPKYTDEFVELIAWIWTEGSISNDGFCITQSNKVNEKNVDRIRRVLQTLCPNPIKGCRYLPNSPYWSELSEVARPDITKFFIGKEIANEFWTVFKEHKVVDPKFITELTYSQLRLFVGVSLLGDGYLKPKAGGPIIVQENEEQLIAVEMACTLLGIPTSLKKWSIDGYPDRWHLNLLKSMQISPKRSAQLTKARGYENGMKITREEYVGTVWCPRTTNKNWLARRNGTVFYTGNTMYKIDAIAKERHGIGVPIIKLPLGYTTEDRNIAENLGRNLRVNERAHIVAPSNWDIEFAKLEGQPVDCMTSVRHHDQKILSNILAPFLDDPKVKSDSLDMFMKSTRYIATNIGDMINKFVIQKLVNINFARGGYPTLHARRIGEWEDMRTMSFTLRNLVGAGMITPDDELERQLRREIDMPPMDKETARVVKTPQVKPSPAGPPRQSTKPPVGLPQKNSGTDKSGG